MKINEALKRFRDEFKLTQTQVAGALGILQQTYYKYESGKNIPSAEFVLDLANKYNVSADYLLGRSDTPRPVPYDEQEVRRAIEFRDSWLKFNRLRNEIQADGQVPAQ